MPKGVGPFFVWKGLCNAHNMYSVWREHTQAFSSGKTYKICTSKTGKRKEKEENWKFSVDA